MPVVSVAAPRRAWDPALRHAAAEVPTPSCSWPKASLRSRGMLYTPGNRRRAWR